MRCDIAVVRFVMIGGERVFRGKPSLLRGCREVHNSDSKGAEVRYSYQGDGGMKAIINKGV